MYCGLFKGCKLNNRDEAYLFGVIYARGSIIPYAGREIYSTMKIEFSNSEENEKYLKMLNNYFHGNLATYEYKDKKTKKNYQILRLSIFNCAFAEKLKKMGLRQKTNVEENSFTFEDIDDEYKWDFIRGYFDCSGHIRENKDNQFYIEASCKSFRVMSEMNQFINQNINSKVKTTQGDGVYRIRYGGNKKINRIFDLMYYDNCIRLDSKYQKLSKVKEKI